MVCARKKLNSASVFGALLVAALIGGITGSWLMFFLAGGVLLSLSLYTGDIRPQPVYH